MKKILAFVMAVFFACGLCGCTGSVKADSFTPVLNGKAIDLPQPVTIEDLGSDYSLALGVVLMYKGNASVGVAFKEGYDDTDELKIPIDALVRSYVCDTENTSFSIGGIELGDKRQEVLDVYGEPTYKDEALKLWKYCHIGRSEDEFWLGFQFGDSSNPNKVTSIYYRFQ